MLPTINTIIIIIVSGTAIVAIIYAITIKVRQKLREGETLKYEFITIIAHKFRTPLTQVKWSAEDLLQGEKDPYRKQTISEILESNEKLIKLTANLIEMTDSRSASHSAYVFNKINLCDFVKASAENSKKMFGEKNIFFSVKCEDHTIQSNIDQTRLEFVLQTIFENACTYTPVGRTVQVTVKRSNKKAIINVKDDGIGIAPADMSNIFTKFFRAKNAQLVDTEGFGIGLYLSNSVVQHHGGHLNIHSEGVGKGTTLSVVLPIAK